MEGGSALLGVHMGGRRQGAVRQLLRPFQLPGPLARVLAVGPAELLDRKCVV